MDQGAFNLWRLAHRVTLKEAALLAVYVDPSSREGIECEAWRPDERPPGYEAMKVAIKDAIERGLVVGKIVPKTEYDWNGNPCGELNGTADIELSTAFLPSLEDWLISVGRGPIFPDSTPRGGSPVMNNSEMVNPLAQLQAENADLKAQLEQAQQQASGGKDDESERALGTRERNTLLAIVGVLCKAQGYDLSQPRKAGGSLQSLALQAGITISDKTIAEHLKRIPEAMEARSADTPARR